MKDSQDRLSSIRRSIGNRSSRPTAPQRRKSRREQEAQHQRVFFLSMLACIALVVLILGGGIIYEYVIKPNAVLAEVNGDEIRRKDYWKYQSVVLYDNARQYESIASQFQAQQPDQAAQYLQFAASFDLQREEVWGSTEVSDITVQQMIDDQLYLDGAEAMGISVSDDEAELLALNRFSLPDAPLVTPQPTPTISAARSDMATQTAEAELSIALGTPVSSRVAATPVTDDLLAATPASDPTAAPAATPTASSVATPAGEQQATPTLEESRTTAEIEFEIFQDEVFGPAHMSMDDFLRLWVVPQAVRERVDYQLTSTMPQSDEQVEAEHILVGTEDLANEIYAQVTGGADFEQIARTSSTDAATSPTGGKLGWFTRAQMVPAFADVAFALQPGEVSEPVQTQYGWHVIKVLDRSADRPLSTEQYSLATETAISNWLESQRAQSDVSTDYQPEPTPTPAQFEVPPGAPTPIVATPIQPTEAPLQGPQQVFATPLADVPAASPIAVPMATPAALPDATPSMSPQSGNFMATPEATPMAALESGNSPATPGAVPISSPQSSPES
jgi:parvulin-like peptidyl-prolyl isomerase